MPEVATKSGSPETPVPATANGKVVLFGNRRSGLTKAVRLALHEKSTDYDLIYLESADIASGALDGVNPYRMTPTLTHGSTRIFETAAILFYVATAFDGTALISTDPARAAKALSWTLAAAGPIYGDIVTGLVTERLLPPLEGRSCDETKIASFTTRTVRHLEIIEVEFASNPYLAGASPSIADLMLTPIVHYLMQTPERNLLSAHPRLSDWYARMTTRPSALHCL